MRSPSDPPGPETGCRTQRCEFWLREVDFLGHIVLAYGIAVNPRKGESVTDWPRPTTVMEIQNCLGLTGYHGDTVAVGAKQDNFGPRRHFHGGLRRGNTVPGANLCDRSAETEDRDPKRNAQCSLRSAPWRNEDVQGCETDLWRPKLKGDVTQLVAQYLARKDRKMRYRTFPYVKDQRSNHEEREATWGLESMMRVCFPESLSEG